MSFCCQGNKALVVSRLYAILIIITLQIKTSKNNKFYSGVMINVIPLFYRHFMIFGVISETRDIHNLLNLDFNIFYII